MESHDRSLPPEELLEHATWIQALARSLVRDPGTADDLVQETWLAALKRPLRGGRATRAWLSTVLTNFARQRARSEKSRGRRERETARDESLPSPDELAARLDRQRLLVEAVARLGEPYRETVILRYYEGLPTTEIARRLGVPAGTVRVRLMRAHDRLRADLDRSFGGDRGAWMQALLPLADASAGTALVVPAGETAFLGGMLAMKKLVIAIGVVALVGGAYVLTEEREPVDAVQPAAEEVAAVAAPFEAEVDASDVAARTPGSRRVAVPSAPVGATEAGSWLAGRVALPSEAPPDATLEAFALRDAGSYAELVRGEAEVLGSATVAGDGTFRIPLAADVTRAHLHVRGRFLYTTRTVEADVLGEPVELRPRLGTWLRVAFEGPAPADLVAGALVLFRKADRGESCIGDEHDVHLGTTWNLADGGGFELRAIPSAYDYELAVMPAGVAAGYRIVDDLRPGAEERVALEIEAGARLRGRVVDDAGGPIAGAAVEALIFGVRYGVQGIGLRTVLSDAEGAFELEALPGRRLTLRARREGYLENKLTDVDVPTDGLVDDVRLVLDVGQSIAGTIRWPDGSPAAGVAIGVSFDETHGFGPGSFNRLRGAEGSGRSDAEGRFRITGLGAGPFVLAARAERETADGPLAHDARVDGVAPDSDDLELVLHPPLALRGVVRTETGEAVEEFRVEALRVVEGALGATATAHRVEAFRSADGAFLLGGLSGGRWRVDVSAPEHVLAEPLEVDLPMAGDAAIELTLPRSAAVTGVVVDHEGLPVQRARVQVDTGRSDLQIEISGIAPKETRTDEEGAFALVGLPPQETVLFAVADGFTRSEPVRLPLTPGSEVHEVVLALRLGGTLTGEVYDADGNPDTGQMISVYRWSLGDFDGISTTSDDEGRFRFDHLDTGDWNVMSMAPDTDYSTDAPGKNMGAMLGSMKFAAATLREGEASHVVLGAPAADPVRVHGEVLLGGEPYVGAVLNFHPEGEGLFTRRKTAPVDEDGRYELEVDAPGAFIVTVQTLPGSPGHQNTIELRREVPEETDVTLDFRVPNGRVSGRVLGPDGAPAAGARITLTLDEPLRSDRLFGGHYTEIQTDSSGAYDIPALSPGTYRLAAGGSTFFDADSRARFARVVRDGIALGDGEWRKGVDFRLPEPGSIEVLVRDTDGTPVPNATVFVRDEGGRPIEPFSVSSTDTSGRNVYSGLAPGRYTVSARTGDMASRESAPVRVASGETARVALDLEPGTILLVRLVGPGGEPTPARVRITDAEGLEVEGVFGLADLQVLVMEGGFAPEEHRIGPLPPGRYDVEAETAGGWRADRAVNLSGQAERMIKLRLR